jgi:glutamate--cysteine ligase
MARDVSDTTPITSRNMLVEWLEAGSKTGGAPLLIGTEHEKIPFYAADDSPVPYEGSGVRGGVRALLEGLRDTLGWAPILDRDALIGLYQSDGGGAIRSSPADNSNSPGLLWPTFTPRMTSLTRISRRLRRGPRRWACGSLILLQSEVVPLGRRDDAQAALRHHASLHAESWRAQARYDVRTSQPAGQPRLRRRGRHGSKTRVGLALQPLITAMFANSPFLDGKPTGRLSQRSHLARHRSRPNRHAALRPSRGFGFERYVDYALDVPMYFVKRGDVYHDVAGASFRDLMEGRLQQLPGERATMSDWANHLSTIFPEVRLKTYLEMRGADAGPRAHFTALPALCAGLFYDAAGLDQARELTKGWSAAARQALRADVPGLALDARIEGRSLRDVGRDVLALAKVGLRRRARLDAKGRDGNVLRR